MKTVPESPKLRIERGPNYYSLEVQGKANEPICVAGVLHRAKEHLQLTFESSLEEIVNRLDDNAPRVAVIAGSPDHPAHVMDHETVLKAAASIWLRGGVPFVFGVPVLCDGTAQSTPGMCYSLASRNLVTAMVVNQMEGQLYHGAFVVQGCDKTPSAIVNALASLDRTRQARGEAPVFASFAPAHVMRGGVIPGDLKKELFDLAGLADAKGYPDLGDDIRFACAHILQCAANQALQGIFTRAQQSHLLTGEKHKELEKRLAVFTCHEKGGVCAFNGTGNSSRFLTAALGLVHPALELLTEPPSFEQVDRAVEAMLSVCNNPKYSVSNVVRKNIANAVRVHSAMGGSTNIMMHLISSMIYSGVRFSVNDYGRIRRETKIPDLFNYSLTEGRDIYELARQFSEGLIHGVETVLYELKRNGAAVTEDAPTMTGTTWRERLQKGKRLSADGVKHNPIILSKPRRAVSGIDLLQGNFFESAVVKVSGMPDEQLDEFDEKIAVVLYFESEEQAVSQLLNARILDAVVHAQGINRETLMQIYRHNLGEKAADLPDYLGKKKVFRRILEEGGMRVAVVIAGQGPRGYGMPEMFTPMQHINHNKLLKPIATLISDGRYSGVSYGAAIGHVTPEAAARGGILYLQTGDLLHLRLRRRRIHLLDAKAFRKGDVQKYEGNLEEERANLGIKRLKRLAKRQLSIDPSNRMIHVTDAAHGVVPCEVWERAERKK